MSNRIIRHPWLLSSTVALLLVASACSTTGADRASPAVDVTDATTANGSTPTSMATSASPADAASAIELATDFLTAYFALDADRALDYLTDAGVASMSDTPESFRVDVIQAGIWRYQKRLTEPCEVSDSSPTDSVVRCAYEYDAFGSDELGVGPFVGNYYDVTISDGRIDSVVDHDSNYQAVSSAVWDPFESWARATHPEDADVLFGDAWWHTEESFRVWKQRLREFIDEQLAST